MSPELVHLARCLTRGSFTARMHARPPHPHELPRSRPMHVPPLATHAHLCQPYPPARVHTYVHG
eukprot:2116851-Lingulodinium_polyedra.AAC.1